MTLAPPNHVDPGVSTLQPTILIVEDEVGPREALKMILRPFFNLYSVDSADVALQVLKEQPIDVVTLDLKLPGRQGMEVLKEIKRVHEDVEVIIITGYGSLESAIEGIRYGVSAYLLKPFDVSELIEVINQTLAKKSRLGHLRDLLRTIGSLWGTDLTAAEAWKHLSKLLESKHPELVRHSSRVNFYSALLAEHLNLSQADRETLQIGAYLHDIGKVGIDDRLLSNQTSLDNQQHEGLRPHPEIGARMVRSLPFPIEVAQIIRHHHEHFDGSGYPDHLRGESIPLLARIVCLANAFDNLLTPRVGHRSLSLEEAREYVRLQADVLFDPRLAVLFSQIVR
jgi:putative two-component system response regulator